MAAKYDDIIERNVLVLLKRTVRIKEKRYLRLVCLDIGSGELIILSDNNGRPSEGIHSWNKDIGAVKEMQVVRAKFLTFMAANKSTNRVVLFVSRFEVVAKAADLVMYIEKTTTIKMREMIAEKSRLLLKELGEYAEAALKKPCPQPALLSAEEYFTNLEAAGLPEYRYDLVELFNVQMTDKAPLLWNIKVKITDERFQASLYENKYFSGLALFHGFYDNKESKSCFFAERLYGDFTDGEVDGFAGFTKSIEDLESLPEMLFAPDLSDYPDPEELDYWDDMPMGYPVFDPHDLALENDPGWYAYDLLESYLEQRETEIESVPSQEEQMHEEISEVLQRLDLLLGRLPEYLISDPQDRIFAVDYRTGNPAEATKSPDEMAFDESATPPGIANPAYELLEYELPFH